MVDYLIMLLSLCFLYLFGMALITRAGRKKEFDREYQWLVKHIESMSDDQADTAIVNFSDRWEGHINHFSLSFHISRLVRLRLKKRFR
jgi:hypothetical protein